MVLTVLGIAVFCLLWVIGAKHNYVALFAVQTRVRIENLANGCELYKNDNNFYPGQNAYDRLGIGAAGKASGYLARCLFTEPNGAFPTSCYSAYEQGMLGWKHPSAPAQSDPCAICDPFADRLPILYFPYNTKTGSFIAPGATLADSCNGAYILGTNNAAPSPVWGLKDAPSIKDDRDRLLKGRFLLIGAGRDRLFGTQDDVKNW